MSHAMNVLGTLSPSMASLADPVPGTPSPVKTLVPGLGAGLAGFFAFRNSHPLLGFIGGESLGMNTYRLVRNEGDDRTLALCNLTMTGAAVVGSLVSPNHKFLGFVAGLLAGALITSTVSGSNAHTLRKGLGL